MSGVTFDPCIIDVSVEDATDEIVIGLEDSEQEISVQVDSALLIPIIPDNWCQFSYDGTKLHFF